VMKCRRRKACVLIDVDLSDRTLYRLSIRAGEGSRMGHSGAS
jgi:hypothetical protein